jgi:ribonucleoside-diphosphate reductase alpha chain
MEINHKILSDIAVWSKYAKYDEAKQRRETWEELVARNMEMHIQKFPNLETLIRTNYELVLEKKVLPSMRSLQFSGKPIEVNNARLFNCSYLHIDDYRAFNETMFLLLSGTGVGYSVSRNHINKLPAISKPTKQRRFLIPDNIEGWADAVKVLMKSYFGLSSWKPNFDFRSIRAKGEKLITSGGVAPGPEPLKICLTHIEAILERKKDGEQLTSLECHDILCHIANAVLAGGIRRSAMIALFDHDDQDMLTCKSGKWYESNPQRGRANNSVKILRNGEVSKEMFLDLWKKVELSNAGEPGFLFTNDLELGTNPCAEISLNSFQFCVSGDTKLITKDGIVSIKDAVGTNVEIWNGEEWSTVNPYKTGDNDRLHRVHFSDGSYIDATDNHKFLVKTRFEKEFREVETLDLIELLKSTKYGLQIPRANINNFDFGYDENKAFDYGFVLGDGFLDGGRIKANLYANDKKISFVSSKEINNYYSYNNTPYTTIQFDVDVDFAKELKYSYGIPNVVFSWSKKSIIEFISGWIDADGCEASNGIRLYGREDKIRDAQLLLTKCGINSSVNLMQKAGVKTNLGVRKNDVWYLQITKTSDLVCQRVKSRNNNEANKKGKFQIVKSIETLIGRYESFCLTENKLHQCVFNNVLTKQCNLVEINASDIIDQFDFEQRSETAAFIGTLQASYTDFHYLRPEWKEVTEREALLGVGMTGIASGKILNLDIAEAAEAAVRVNKFVAATIGINEAARVTTVKPSGTASIVLGCSSGVHTWHSKYYIRRMRVGKSEALYTYMLINHPELLEDSVYDSKEAYVSVPIAAPAGALTRDSESAIDFLERVKFLHEKWIKPGHVYGENTHNISATVTMNPGEWKMVGEWLWENQNHYNGLSFLPEDLGSYQQTPFEEIDEAKHLELSKNLKGLNVANIIEINDNTNLSGEVACGGNGCEIV